LALLLTLVACSQPLRPDPVGGPVPLDCAVSASLTEGAAAVPLAQRGYVVSRDSDELTVLDLTTFEVIGRLRTCSGGAHMAELSRDFARVFLAAPQKNEVVAVDARTLAVEARIPVGGAPGHASMSADGRHLAVMNEASSSVSFVDPVRNVEVRRVEGFYAPHFARFSRDGRYAFVANLAAHHISRVDLRTYAIDQEIPLDGFGLPPTTPLLEDEDGFADVQIDEDGLLYAAHGHTSRVLVYDTRVGAKVRELGVGLRPWVVYAEHPFQGIGRHLVPSFDDQSVTLIDRTTFRTEALPRVADRQSYGVNYSPLAPGRAFVMNRIRRDIAVLDTDTGTAVKSIPVGGTTETASTTADGRFIVATVSSENRVAVIDAATATLVKTLDGVGAYPWSITVPQGQNYCH
jgi:DNA-binding beta-propeller fold protein YncE